MKDVSERKEGKTEIEREQWFYKRERKPIKSVDMSLGNKCNRRKRKKITREKGINEQYVYKNVKD